MSAGRGGEIAMGSVGMRQSSRDISAFQDDLRHSLFGSVGDGERDIGCAQLAGKFRCLAVKQEGRSSTGLAGHFNIAPADAVIPTGTDRLHARFLSGKTRSITFDAVGLRLAVLDLDFGKDAVEKALLMPFDRFADSWNLGDVDAGANDHAGNVSARS